MRCWVSDDIFVLNRRAWDAQVEHGNRWTVPVSADEVEAARNGDWKILLTPTRPVPRDWFPEMKGARILCLASGGGQQGPILAAAGARVTVYDGSPKQLERDREVAEREGLELETVEGDMADLQNLGDESFDLVVHPVSNAFVPDVRPVWSECARVLRSGGELLAGFTNPIRYLFPDDLETGSDRLCVAHRIPYSDVEALSDEQKARQIAAGEPFEFSHTLADQIAGQLSAGFVLTGFYEDAYAPEDDALSRFIPSFVATRARKERR
jgi:SAM-dependent methyltransferase